MELPTENQNQSDLDMDGAGKRAIIVGGSMGGLFSGLLLLRAGWEVDVYERVAVELTARGAGIVTHPELDNVIELAGLNPNSAPAVPILERRTLDRQGRVIGKHTRRQMATSWNGLFRMLRGAFPEDRYHLGSEFLRCEVSSSGVTAWFADGSVKMADVLSGADGIRSSVRRQFLPDCNPIYAGYVAWRGLIDEASFPPELHRELFDYFAFDLPPGEQMLGYPVSGRGDDTRPGHRRYNFVWYRPADTDTLTWMLTDESGQRHEISIPPPLISKAVIEHMRQEARRVLSPQFQELIALTAQPFLQPIYDLESPRLGFERAAILGDAAFIARPHVGAGVAKAAMDALALVSALQSEETVPAALARYEQERLPQGQKIVHQAQRLGSYVRSEIPIEADRTEELDLIMKETAVLDFMQA